MEDETSGGSESCVVAYSEWLRLNLASRELLVVRHRGTLDGKKETRGTHRFVSTLLTLIFAFFLSQTILSDSQTSASAVLSDGAPTKHAVDVFVSRNL